ncbi:MAG: phosphate transport system regulatory protein PhoU [Ignavibacteriales bacterium]|nr:MAG: phosphate transport system regulatory protein PhoU [Ignavibacteriales bacterium]
MERHFEQQLEKLKTRVIKMCSLVDEQVELSIRAISEPNIELAQLVIERDKKVDKYDLKIDKICQKLLAITQPVATDLRLIMSSLLINNNLERMGDIAVNIASQAAYFKEKPEFMSEIKFEEAAKMVINMVRSSIDSFVDKNAVIAKNVLNMDDQVDHLVSENCKSLIEIMKRDKSSIDQAIRLYTIMHQLERLGDHSTNIAEYVYFIVEAQVIKHRYEEILWKKEDEDLND